MLNYFPILFVEIFKHHYWRNIVRKCFKEISDKLLDNEVRIEQTLTVDGAGQ